jgi:hypothetical protein
VPPRREIQPKPWTSRDSTRSATSLSEHPPAPTMSIRQRSSRGSARTTSPAHSHPSSERSVRLGQAATAPLTTVSSITAPTTSGTRSRSRPPHAGERDIEGPPETQLLEARGDREAVELALHVGGGVDPQFEYAQRGAPRREPARQQGDGEGAVDDELLEPRRGADHPADGLVGRLRLGSAGGGLEGAPREVERGEVRHAVAPASRDAGAGRDVPGFAHLREDVLHDAVRERVHADALHPWRRRDAIGVKGRVRNLRGGQDGLDGGRRKDADVVIWISKFRGSFGLRSGLGGISGSWKWWQSLFGVAAGRRWARGVVGGDGGILSGTRAGP